MCTKVWNDIVDPRMVPLKVDQARDPSRRILRNVMPGPGVVFGIHNNSVKNLRRGLTERVYYTDAKGTKPLHVEKGAFEKLKPFEEKFKAFPILPASREEFVNHYKGGRKVRYQNAYEKLMSSGKKNSHATVQTFVKAEKINFTSKPDPAPRVIQPRDARFNIEFGRYIWKMEHKIYKALGRLYKYPCVAKGFNCYETGEIIKKKWDMFENPCFVSLDASRFDQHVSQEALKWTHRQYRKFNHDEDFVWCLDRMLSNKGYATAKDGGFKYTVDRGRMSGDMDTALGNCLLMVAMVYSYCTEKGIRHEVIDNGDDITVVCDVKDKDRVVSGLMEWFAELGFRMKVEASGNVLEKLEFCQTYPVFDGVKWRMVRGLNCLVKDTVLICDEDEAPYRIGEVSECGKALCDGLPIYSTFYNVMNEMGKRSRGNSNQHHHSGMRRLAEGLEYKGLEVTDEARLSFYNFCGINPSRQRDIEEQLLTWAGRRVTPIVDREEITKESSHLFEWLEEQTVVEVGERLLPTPEEVGVEEEE